MSALLFNNPWDCLITSYFTRWCKLVYMRAQNSVRSKTRDFLTRLWHTHTAAYQESKALKVPALTTTVFRPQYAVSRVIPILQPLRFNTRPSVVCWGHDYKQVFPVQRNAQTWWEIAKVRGRRSLAIKAALTLQLEKIPHVSLGLVSTGYWR